jgi:hypothetical protein
MIDAETLYKDIHEMGFLWVLYFQARFGSPWLAVEMARWEAL